MVAKRKVTPKAKSKRYRILSLDGGGIRGVIPAFWLRALEKRLSRPLHEHFDLIAGTSTGSILACALASGIRAAELVDLYEEFGQEVFPGRAARLWSRVTRTFSQGVSAPKYDDEGLARALKRQLGDGRFGDLKTGVLVTTYDVLSRQAVVMKTFPDGVEREFDDLPVWEVAKASSSAPTYFPAHVTTIGGVRVPLVDGGVVANNPAACAIAEGIKVNGKRPPERKVGLADFVVASFGTGETTRPISISEAREWGALEWAIPVIDVLFDGAADSVHYIAKQLVAEGRYFRFQARLDEAYDDMDNASRTNINALKRAAQGYLQSGPGDGQLEAIAKLVG